ncbi:iron-containing alcohol dehydrogenase [Latilactobacillus fuchuensis]|uniref:Iron-containing alcohol dehydrogenase n=1 Tax=Latilactobacillus fuchuensis TaxID=164393 RepID=A0A2N9DWS9_9LACO|nr:iron-containing alcohol dehydrogenase [Latilactobacillus fuchuensis]SPC39128.1 Iron-containing alcohol dehydrogenase [Latilactobacillus fuchuensis]
MQNFDYYNPAHIYFGKGQEELVGDLTAQYSKHKNALVLYSGDYYNFLGISELIRTKFKKSGISYVECGEVVPNPQIKLVRQLCDLVRDKKIDFILAVGGGSVIDTAKAVSFGALYDGDPWDFFAGKAVVENALPVGVLSTAASSGSEMSNATIIDNDNYKLGVETSLIIPSFTIMNPVYTQKIPAYQTGVGISDIMSHMLERYFTLVKDVDLTDRLLESVMYSLMNTAKKLLKDPENYQLRAEIMWAAVTAHNNFLECGREPDWGSHRIEHEISAEYGVVHGEGMAVVTPAWMEYTSQNYPDKFVQLAARLFGVNTQVVGEDEAIKILIGEFRMFFKELGMKDSLQSLGIEDKKQFKKMAERATHNDESPVGHYQKLYVNDIVEILNRAF